MLYAVNNLILSALCYVAFFAFNTVYSEIRFSLLHRKVYSIQKQLVVIKQASHDIRSEGQEAVTTACQVTGVSSLGVVEPCFEPRNPIRSPRGSLSFNSLRPYRLYSPLSSESWALKTLLLQSQCCTVTPITTVTPIMVTLASW